MTADVPDPVAVGEGGGLTDFTSSLQSRLTAAEAARDEAQRLRKEDRAWYEMTVSVVEEQRDNARAARDEACARAERLEKANKLLASDLKDLADYLETKGIVSNALERAQLVLNGERDPNAALASPAPVEESTP